MPTRSPTGREVRTLDTMQLYTELCIHPNSYQRVTVRPPPSVVTRAPCPVVHVNGIPVVVRDGAARLGDGPRVVLRFSGPVPGTWRHDLRRVGARPEFSCPPSGACVTVPRAAVADALAALPGVAGFVPYDEALCDRGLGAPDVGPGRQWLDVVCLSRAQRPLVDARLRELGATVLDQGSTKVRILWPGDPAPCATSSASSSSSAHGCPRPAPWA